MSDPTTHPAVTDASYLRIDDLLSLQQPRSAGPEHDEQLEFLSFRRRLEAASGFQSDQFRQIEFVVGVKNEASTDIQGVLIEVYRKDPEHAELCERLVDLDEGVQEWRDRHVKMVERTIGSKSGSGGSAGAAYLRATIGRNIFPDLWDIRSQL